MNIRVLVLNQDYSPLTICNIQRAFMLIWFKKAELIHAAKNRSLRTVSTSYPLPVVVRLIHYISVPYKGVMLGRQNIFKRDNFQCQYCGSKKNLTIDHVIPKSKNGKSTWNNLVTACKKCNSRKGDFSLDEANMKLKRKPFKPSYILFLRDFSGLVCEEWLPYLQTKKK